MLLEFRSFVFVFWNATKMWIFTEKIFMTSVLGFISLSLWISRINTICLESTIVSRELIYGGKTLLQHLCFLCVRSNKAGLMEAKDKGGQQPDRWDNLNLTEGETSKDIRFKLSVTTVKIHLQVMNCHHIQAPLLSPSLSSSPSPLSKYCSE